MPSSKNTIEDFHDEIVQWRKEGLGLRPITKRLQERGLTINFNAVDRYCRNQGIEKAAPPTTDARAGGREEEPSVEAGPDTSLFPQAIMSAQAPAGRLSLPARTPVNTPVLQAVRADAASEPAPEAGIKPNAPPRGDRPPPSYVVESATASSLKRPPVVLDAGVLVLPTTARQPQATDLAGVPQPGREPKTPEPSTPPAAVGRSSTVRVPPVQWRDPPPLFTPLVRVPDWTHDLELLRFGEEDVWALQDACEGVFILGATGSGKTTGSGRTIAEAFLSCGFGGLVLTVKPEEVKLWEDYAERLGRKEQLCVVRPGGRYRFNFLNYERRRPGVGGGLIENLVSLFYTIIDARAQGQNDSTLVNFWTNAGKELVRNTFRVLALATPTLSLAEARKFITESPHQQGAKTVPAGEWFTQCMERAAAAAKGGPQESVMKAAEDYWHGSFLRLASDTRSCIVSAFSAMADVFIEPAINELFCGETTITPEAVMDGAIIVIDLPLKNYDAVGLFAQSIWKYLFQKAIERRNDPKETRRPVFLWIDEAQYFHTAYDSLFQSTARSSRCATVYLTQNISNFYGIAGSSRSRERVDGFLGNLNTKIFHCNNDHTSNVWAAEQIGRYSQYRHSTSINEQPPQQGGGWFSSFFDKRSTTNVSSQQHIDYAVQPSEFLNLRTGGKRFDSLVDAYFVKGGATYSTGRHFFPTVFRQEFA